MLLSGYVHKMRKIKLSDINLKKIRLKFKEGFHNASEGSFRQIFGRINQLGIKQGVDQLGLDKFINQCALLAAGSGIITGAGGPATMAVGVPLDIINLITQQFRVTLAVTYYKTGNYQVSFDEFFKLLTTSMKGDVGITVTKTAMDEVAQKLMVNMGAKATRRLVPVVGAVIGGSANYFFIKRIGESLKNGKKI
jgi:hypothetical protein